MTRDGPGGAGNDVGALRHVIISLHVQVPLLQRRCRRLPLFACASIGPRGPA